MCAETSASDLIFYVLKERFHLVHLFSIHQKSLFSFEELDQSVISLLDLENKTHLS